MPSWGKPEEGNASDKPLNTTILSQIAPLLAPYGVPAGAYIYVADVALVTADKLRALGESLFITRLPATYGECGRVSAEAVTQESWEAVGGVAPTTPTKNRPGASSKGTEGQVQLYAPSYRAVGVQSSAQDKRRLTRLEREGNTSSQLLAAAGRIAPKQDYCCRDDAEAAAAKLRATPSAYHHVEVSVEERPKYGQGRPSPRNARMVKAMRYGLTATVPERDAVLARTREAADCCVLLTHGPTEGPLAHGAREVLQVYKEQHGGEQNFAFLKAPVIVKRRFLKKPERIEALGVVLLLALLLWRLMERQMRQHVETAGLSLTGWDKKATERPTSFMMTTKFAGGLVLKVGRQRHLARPLSTVQQQYLTALGLVASCCTCPSGSESQQRAGRHRARLCPPHRRRLAAVYPHGRRGYCAAARRACRSSQSRSTLHRNNQFK